MDDFKKNPMVYVVIIAYNQFVPLKKCLESIRAGSRKPDRILIIDNSINDEIKDNLSLTPDSEYWNLGENFGFTRGCNFGIQKAMEAGSRYIWLLNPDTQVDFNCLENLFQCAETQPDAGIVAGEIRYTDAPDRLWYAGGSMSYFQGVGKHHILGTAAENTLRKEISYATGCCMFIRHTVFTKIGMMNEKIFMYLDDAEFSIRVQSHQFKIFYEPSAKLSHSVGPGLDFLQYPDYYIYFSIRNKPFVAHFIFYRIYLHIFAWILGGAKLLIYGLHPKVRGRKSKLRAIVFGMWDSLFEKSVERIRFPRLFRAC